MSLPFDFNDSDYLFPGYNGIEPLMPEDIPAIEKIPDFDQTDDDFKYIRQGYYDIDDDKPPMPTFEDEWEREECMLNDFFGTYYTDKEYLEEGKTRDMLLEEMYEFIDYNNSFGYDYYGYSDYGCCSGFYGYANSKDYAEYERMLEEQDDTGRKKPAHSIANPVDIKKQKGPKCSAYASTCLLRYFGKDADPDEYYKKFLKLPDGSAIPSSVGKKIGAKINTNGKVSDLEKMIDAGKPVLVLVFYNEEPGWDNLHYVLVTGYDKDNIYIADSLHSSGKRYYNRTIPRKKFKKMWNTSRSLPVKLVYGRNIYYEMSFTDVGAAPKHV